MAYLLFTILFTWFQLGSLGFPTGFPEIVFSSPISFHIFGIDPGWSLRLYPGIYIGRPKQRTWIKQIAKSPTKHRALSFSTGLLCKETPVLRSAILLQPCTTHLFPDIFQLYIHLLLVKERTRNMRFSRSCLWCEGFRYEYDVTRPMPPTAR